MSKPIFASYVLGRLTLANRIVMAPMTRCRATGNFANDLIAEYYRLRATAGLIISEGISPSPNGLGYARMPGMFNDTQVKSWQPVTNAVHQAGGRIFAQLMHSGRVSHPSNMPAGAKILAPSALAAPGEMWTDAQGQQVFPTPAVMTEDDIAQAIAEYGNGSRLALQAGFDGVELHAANGYLIDQFLNTASNKRTDAWGGSIENRLRFAIEVARAAVSAIGADRVGMRISPYGVFNGQTPDPDMDVLYLRLIEEANKLGLVYIHVVDHSAMGAPEVSPELKRKIRTAFKGTYIRSGTANLNNAISGNSGYIDGPKAVREQGVSDGEEEGIGAAHASYPQSGIQGARCLGCPA